MHTLICPTAYVSGYRRDINAAHPNTLGRGVPLCAQIDPDTVVAWAWDLPCSDALLQTLHAKALGRGVRIVERDGRGMRDVIGDEQLQVYEEEL